MSHSPFPSLLHSLACGAFLLGTASSAAMAGENSGSLRAMKDEARRLQTNLDFAKERYQQGSRYAFQRPAYDSLRSSPTPQWNYHPSSSNFASPSASLSNPLERSARPAATQSVVVSHRETPPETAARMEKEANGGKVDSQMWLAHMYYDGWGVAKNFAKAATWYQKAANGGNADAEFFLATLYRNGEGVAKSPTQAAAWYRKAAEWGHTGAAFTLGNATLKGEAGPPNAAAAVRWYKQAADAGHEESQLALGLLFELGERLPGGVPKDYAQSSAYYAKAADQGNTKAMCDLASYYFAGRGVAKDELKAGRLWMKAAEKGEAEGQAMAAKLCFFGQCGTQRDLPRPSLGHAKRPRPARTRPSGCWGSCRPKARA